MRPSHLGLPLTFFLPRVRAHAFVVTLLVAAVSGCGGKLAATGETSSSSGGPSGSSEPSPGESAPPSDPVPSPPPKPGPERALYSAQAWRDDAGDHLDLLKADFESGVCVHVGLLAGPARPGTLAFPDVAVPPDWELVVIEADVSAGAASACSATTKRPRRISASAAKGEIRIDPASTPSAPSSVLPCKVDVELFIEFPAWTRGIDMFRTAGLPVDGGCL